MPRHASTVLARTTAFTGRVFHVDRERVRLPQGHTTILDIVRHRGSVVLIPQPDPRHVVLIRQFRHAIQRWIWELPAGTMEAGEPARVGARRECEEEIRLTPGRVRRLASFYPTPGFCDEVMHFFLCERLRPLDHEVHADEDEAIVPRTFSLREVDRLIARRQVVDMKTVVGMRLIRQARGTSR